MSTSIPSAAAALPEKGLYFGWRVVFAMFLATTMVYGNTFYGFIILTEPLAQEFRWSATQTGSLVSAMWMVAPLALVVAPVILRFGALPMVIFGLTLQALTLALLGQVDSFGQLYALRVIMGVGKVIAVVSVPVMITTWFSRRFATAMALAWCGGSFGGFVMSPTTERLAASLGWRGASLSLAAIMAAAIVIIILLCRGARAPADLGLAADGDMAAASALGEPEAEKATYADLRAIPVLTALLMALSVLGIGMAQIAMLTQAPTLMQVGGLSAALAATLLGVSAATSTLGQISVGMLLDRLSVGWCNLITGGALLTGLILLVLLQTNHSPVVAAFAMALFGFGMGGNEMIWITLTKRQFGARLFAFTYGGWSCMMAVGYALGGTVGGWSYDNLPVAAYPMIILTMYASSLLFAVWRPAKRNTA